MRIIHITIPEAGIGDRALALCGETFKVKYLWPDIPEDKPVCKDCIVGAVDLLAEYVEFATRVERHTMLLARIADQFNDTATEKMRLLVDWFEGQESFAMEQADKQVRKEEKKKAKKTCICTWTSAEERETNPDCPIHGEKWAEDYTKQEDEEALPVAPPPEEAD